MSDLKLGDFLKPKNYPKLNFPVKSSIATYNKIQSSEQHILIKIRNNSCCHNQINKNPTKNEKLKTISNNSDVQSTNPK